MAKFEADRPINITLKSWPVCTLTLSREYWWKFADRYLMDNFCPNMFEFAFKYFISTSFDTKK